MIAAYDYYRPIAHADFSGFAREFFVKTHYYAPLVHLGTALFFLVFGASRITGIAINLVSLGVLLGAVYWIGKRLYSPDEEDSAAGDYSETAKAGPGTIARSFANPAVLAGLLAASYHFPAWLIHDAFLDYPLTAMVALSIALLIRAGDFQTRRHALLFGLSAGLGMLTKQTFAFFLLLPAIYIAGRVLARKDRGAILNLALAGLLALAVAAIWYAPHLKDVIAIYKMNQQAALDENEAPLFSLMSNTVYIHGLLSLQVQIVFGALFLCGAIYQGWRWKLSKKGRPHLYSGKRAAPTEDLQARRLQESLILYLWIVSGILCFTLVANKDMRYTVPVLPAVALVSLSWLGRRSSKTASGDVYQTTSKAGWLKAAVAALIAVWAFVSFLNAQWPRGGMGYFIDTPRFRWMAFARNYYGFDHRPLPDDWSVPEIVSTMSRLGSDRAVSYTPKLGVVVNLPYLNPSSVALYARLQSPGRAGAPIVTVIWLVSKSAADQISDCDYLLVRTGLDKAEWLAPLERYSEALIRANPARYTSVAEFPIPLEGAEAVLYKCEKQTGQAGLPRSEALSRLRSK
jgi:4-amino-4-deoxy-L-arabinose transferase-like glycosyltransferase